MSRKGMKMMEDPKQCRHCLEFKARTEFRLLKPEGRAIRSNCFSCDSQVSKNWRNENKEKIVDINRRAKLKSSWGLTPESFADMLRGQGGGCALCGTKTPGGKGTFKVDHCHETGVIRGLLCQFCNVGLGHFKDSPALLTKAISYLKKSRVEN